MHVSSKYTLPIMCSFKWLNDNSVERFLLDKSRYLKLKKED